MYISECHEIVRLCYRVSLDDLLTFPTLSDFCFLTGITYRLAKGQGEFLSLLQHNLERKKVGEGWKGKDEGCGKRVEPADLRTPQR